MFKVLKEYYTAVSIAVAVVRRRQPLVLANEVMRAVLKDQLSAATGRAMLLEAVKWKALTIEDRTAYADTIKLLERWDELDTSIGETKETLRALGIEPPKV